MEPSSRSRLEVLINHFQHADHKQLHNAIVSKSCSSSSQDPPVIIGGMILDIQIRTVPGGVARNVAEGLSRLVPPPLRPLIISIAGFDSVGDTLLNHTKSLGLSVEGIIRLKEASTPTLVAVFDRSGEIAACVADVASLEEHLTSRQLQRHQPQLQSARLVLLDANLSPATLLYAARVASGAGVAVLLEPVSVPKSARSVGCLRHVQYITPNTAELIAMADALCKMRDLPPLPPPEPLPQGAQELLCALKGHLRMVLETGLKGVILTMGARGAALVRHPPALSRPLPSASSHEPSCHLAGEHVVATLEAVHMAALPCTVASLSGAGDCLVAGLLAGILNGCGVELALAYGMAAARCCVESSQNVPLSLSMKALAPHVEQALSMKRVFQF